MFHAGHQEDSKKESRLTVDRPPSWLNRNKAYLERTTWVQRAFCWSSSLCAQFSCADLSKRKVHSRSSFPTTTAAVRLSTSQAAASNWPGVQRFSQCETTTSCDATSAGSRETCPCSVVRAAESRGLRHAHRLVHRLDLPLDLKPGLLPGLKLGLQLGLRQGLRQGLQLGLRPNHPGTTSSKDPGLPTTRASYPLHAV